MSLIKIFKLKFTLNRSTFICSLFIFSSSNLRKVVGPYCSQNCDCSGVILGQGLTGSRFLLRNKFWKTILLIWISMTLKGQSKVHTSDSSSQFGMSKIIQFFFLAFFNNFINEMFYFIKWFPKLHLFSHTIFVVGHSIEGNFIWSKATQEIELFSWCPKVGKL